MSKNGINIGIVVQMVLVLSACRSAQIPVVSVKCPPGLYRIVEGTNGCRADFKDPHGKIHHLHLVRIADCEFVSGLVSPGDNTVQFDFCASSNVGIKEDLAMVANQKVFLYMSKAILGLCRADPGKVILSITVEGLSLSEGELIISDLHGKLENLHR